MILYNITLDTIYFHNFTIILGHHKIYGCLHFTSFCTISTSSQVPGWVKTTGCQLNHGILRQPSAQPWPPLFWPGRQNLVCWFFTREGILGCIFGSGTGYPSVIRYIVLGQMILLKLDGAAPLMTNRASANSMNLHSALCVTARRVLA